MFETAPFAFPNGEEDLTPEWFTDVLDAVPDREENVP